MGFTLLIIEEDSALRKKLTETLETEGYCVVVAAPGSDGLSLLNREPVPNAVLLNAQSKAGERFLAQKNQEPALRAIPVIQLRAPVDLGSLLGNLQGVFKSE